ncbi:MAG: DUF4870 domain-containing protein [Ignavibacteriae bacterium]|nr:DUF4870 domain-containing protein [Ignavibacteriota bacterium]
MENEEIISSDEKVLALVCHLSMAVGGIFVPLIIWAIKKEESKFVRFHSLQSIFYHLAFGVIVALLIIITAVIIVFAGVGFQSLGRQASSGIPAVMIIIIFSFTGIIMLMAFGGIGYAVYLAIKSYNGEKIKIPVIGKIIYEKVYGKN